MKGASARTSSQKENSSLFLNGVDENCRDIDHVLRPKAPAGWEYCRAAEKGDELAPFHEIYT
jgi:hypothetical protein